MRWRFDGARTWPRKRERGKGGDATKKKHRRGDDVDRLCGAGQDHDVCARRRHAPWSARDVTDESVYIARALSTQATTSLSPSSSNICTSDTSPHIKRNHVCISHCRCRQDWHQNLCSSRRRRAGMPTLPVDHLDAATKSNVRPRHLWAYGRRGCPSRRCAHHVSRCCRLLTMTVQDTPGTTSPAQSRRCRPPTK